MSAQVCIPGLVLAPARSVVQASRGCPGPHLHKHPCRFDSIFPPHSPPHPWEGVGGRPDASERRSGDLRRQQPVTHAPSSAQPGLQHTLLGLLGLLGLLAGDWSWSSALVASTGPAFKNNSTDTRRC